MPSSLDLLGLRLNLGHRETCGLHENPSTKKQSNISLLLEGGGEAKTMDSNVLSGTSVGKPTF